MPITRFQGRCKLYQERRGYLEPLGQAAFDACCCKDAVLLGENVEGDAEPFKGCIVEFEIGVSLKPTHGA